MIGLRPWEYYRLAVKDYFTTYEGHQLKQQIDLDGIRWLATIITQSAGNKKIKKPQQLMKLPLLDGSDKENLLRLKELQERLSKPGN